MKIAYKKIGYSVIVTYNSYETMRKVKDKAACYAVVRRMLKFVRKGGK